MSAAEYPSRDAASLIPGPVPMVLADTLHTDAAYLAPDRWNGWAVPFLTREGVETLIRAIVEQGGADAGYHPLRWDGETLLEAYPDADAYDAAGAHLVDEQGTPWFVCSTPILIDGAPYWTPGAYGWTWSEATPMVSIDGMRSAVPAYALEEEAHGFAVAWINAETAARAADLGDLAGITTDDGAPLHSAADLAAFPHRGALVGLRAAWDVE